MKHELKQMNEANMLLRGVVQPDSSGCRVLFPEKKEGV